MTPTSSTAVEAAAPRQGRSSWIWSSWLSDDAFISWRYAQNLVAGNGLVYNPGERVEGYTNFLWTVLLALCQALGLDMEAASVLFAFLATAALTLVVGGTLGLLLYDTALRPLRSCARMICSRSLATAAVFFFSPSRKDSSDITLTSRCLRPRARSCSRSTRR